MKTIKEIPHLDKVKVLMRVDFNVPIENDRVVDDFRIKAILPTLNYLLEKGAKVILIAHLESNEGKNLSLEPVFEHIKGLGIKCKFIKDYKTVHEIVENSDTNDNCFLLENLRFFDGEKANDQKFAEELASLADIYINEAFSVSHRKHASIVGIPAFIPSYAGFQLEYEINHLKKAFTPNRPFLFILGGAKFDTKLPLLAKFIDLADQIFIGGALANNLLKEKGYEIGKSLVSEGDFNLAPFINNPKVLLPLDIVNEQKAVKELGVDVTADDSNLDVGPKTLEMLKSKINTAKFILWNGPVGLYEKGYEEGTMQIARMIADNTNTESVVGGGDTVTAIEKLNLRDSFNFISTGGGAMLDYLAQGTLPGLKALDSSK